MSFVMICFLGQSQVKKTIDTTQICLPYDVAQKKSKARKAQPPKRKSMFDIDMSKEKKISEETLDEAGLGDAAKIVHSLSDKEKALFKAGKKGSILSALRFRRAMSQKQAQAAKEAETAQSKTVDEIGRAHV